ncbi:MAG TPA: S53 family peptidase [Nitrososphaerales archaeon]|nr:S53 family peptidase [Nitrososphaerales archaeon]
MPALAVIFLLALSPLMFVSVASVQPSPAPSRVEPASLIVVTMANVPVCLRSELCPAMLDKAYGFDVLHSGGTNGTGQTIIIDDACGDPTITTDLKTFDSQFGLPNPTLNVIDVQGGKMCVDSGWSVETSLDVEWAHVVAPEATIDLLVASQASPKDVYGAWTYALTNNLGNQISNSWGGAGCGSGRCNNTIGQGIGPCKSISGVNVASILSTAESQHVTVLGSAGDGGAWGQGTSQVQPIPMDCKGVLTVGGTTLNVDSTGAYVSESAWSATGGGYTTLPEPGYQRSAGIVDSYNTLAKPDVAADANPSTGVWFYNAGSGGWGVVGGTSLSSPLWVGFIADVNQIRASNGLSPAGFLQTFLYKTVYGVNGGSSLYALDFHDITTGNNGWPAGTGWDAATGLGSFIGPALASTLGTNPKA